MSHKETPKNCTSDDTYDNLYEKYKQLSVLSTRAILSGDMKKATLYSEYASLIAESLMSAMKPTNN